MNDVEDTLQGIRRGRHTMSLPRVTHHAIDRYLERVDPAATRRQAAQEIRRIVGLGHARSTPRHWMREMVRHTPGLRFVYLAEQPGVCALILDDAVVTIITRQLCRRHPWYPAIVGDVVEPIHYSTFGRTSSEFQRAA